MIDDFDELASAYLDGQATPEEVARIDADPDLQARVAALRALTEELERDGFEPVASTRARHLEAALEAFDQVLASPGQVRESSGTDSTEGVDNDGLPALVEVASARVIDLSERRAGEGSGRSGEQHARPEPVSVRRAADAVEPLRSRRRLVGSPAWLTAAAAAVLVVGGVGVAANNWGGSGEMTASIETSDTGAASLMAEDAGAEAMDEGGGPEAARSGTADADEADAEGETAALAADEPASEEQLDDQRAEQGTTIADDQGDTAGPGGATVAFATVPSAAELQAARAEVELAPPGEATCGGAVVAPAGSALVGVFRVDVAGEGGEALVFANSGGDDEEIVLVSEACEPF